MEKTIDVGGTQVHIRGDGQDTIVMLHGWPDTHLLWRRQVEALHHEYVCVSFTLPGFDRGDRRDYSLADVVEKIRQVVDAVSPDEKVILLLHDWGCVFGYEYALRHSGRVKKVIGLDVGDANSQELRDSLTAAGKLMVFIYQIILAASFVCPAFPGDAIARFMARALGAKSNPAQVHAGMSMPYAMRWFGVNGGLKDLLPVELRVPFFYAYATRKPVMFHAPAWLRRIEATPGNRVQAFDCGHWIMLDEADAFNAAAQQWLRE